MAVQATRHQPQHPATGRADVDLPPRKSPRRLPGTCGPVPPDRRGRGTAAPGVGLLPLPRRDGPRAHRRRGRAVGRTRSRRPRWAEGNRRSGRRGRAHARRGRGQGDDEVRRCVRRISRERGGARTAKAGCPTPRRSSRRRRGEPRPLSSRLRGRVRRPLTQSSRAGRSPRRPRAGARGSAADAEEPRDLGRGRHAFQAELDGCVRDGAHTCFGRHTLDLLAASACSDGVSYVVRQR